MKLEQILQEFPCSVSAAVPIVLSNEKYIYLVFYMDDDSLSDTANSTFSNVPVNRVTTLRFYNYHFVDRQEFTDDEFAELPFSNLGAKPHTFYTLHGEDDSELQQFLFYFDQSFIHISCEEMEIYGNSTDNMKQQLIHLSELL